MPWWGVVLVAVGACALGAGAAYLGLMMYLAKGLWQ